MARAVSFPKTRARERESRILREHWKLFLAIGAFLGLITALMAWIFDGWQVPMWSLLPFGAVVLGWFAYPMFLGTYHLHMADESESWTAGSLRKLRKAGYQATGPVTFDRHDVDHVLVGATGVYAVDTKHTDCEINLASRKDRWQVERWASKANDAAHGLQIRLKYKYGLDVDVHPVAVVWGSEVVGECAEIDAVPVVRPGALGDYIRSGPAHLDAETQKQVLRAAEDMIRIWGTSEPRRKLRFR